MKKVPGALFSRLLRRRSAWCLTRWGWASVALLVVGPIGIWWTWGEPFYAQTRRIPASVLVVEGWIGTEAIRAAALEFAGGGYDYIVTTGGMTSDGWSEVRWNYAVMAQRELERSGMAKEKILVATARDVESQRTYESAVAVARLLESKGIRPKAINVFTYGVHARRSRLIFSKAQRPGIHVGVVAWMPASWKSVPWWQSSDRAEDLIKETAGYVAEFCFSSGRGFIHGKDPGVGATTNPNPSLLP